MGCDHEQLRTVDSVSRISYLKGSRKFRPAYRMLLDLGIDPVYVRKKVCAECGKKATTVELDWLTVLRLLRKAYPDNETIETEELESEIKGGTSCVITKQPT